MLNREQVMLHVGLTGSIAMGKTEVAKMFARLGCPVFDADRAVHELYRPGGEAVAAIAALYPDAVRDGAVDRTRLSEIISNDSDALASIEAIVHPLVQDRRRRFVTQARLQGADIAIFDIPLLYETGADKDDLDKVIVVSADAATQRRRALARPGMNAAKLDAILARQLSDKEKRARADYVIDTGGELDDTFESVKRIHADLVRAAAGKG